jgi:carboxyl-terminal processing protease
MRIFSRRPVWQISTAFLALLALSLLSFSRAEEKLDGERLAPLLPEIMKLHVKQHDMDAAFMRRLLTQFIDQLDPSKNFFLKSEAEAVINRSDDELKALAKQAHNGDFSEYRRLLTDFLATQVARDKDLYASLEQKQDEIKELAKDRESLRKFASLKGKPPGTPPAAHPEVPGTDTAASNTDASEIKWSERATANDERQARLLRQTAGLYAFNKSYLKEPDDLRQAIETVRRERDKWVKVDLDAKVPSLFMKSFMLALDPHSTYLDEEDQAEFNATMERNFAGIGVQIRPCPLGAQVAEVIKGGPADKSKRFAPGDQIVAVDGTVLAGMPINKIVKLIKGEKSTDVKLAVLKHEGGATEEFSIKRDTIELAEIRVKGKTFDLPGGRVAVISVQAFYDGVHTDLKNRLAELGKDKPLAGVVLDLRYNTGGLLQEALGLAGLFIKSGPIVCERDGRNRERWHNDPVEGMVYSGPLAVLTNQFSASASEIVAGTLKEYGRAVVVAHTQTFGKGTVQRLLPLDALNLPGEITLTIAQYFLASGSSVQNKGVEPDLVIPGPKLTDEDGLLERATPNALPWAKIEGRLDAEKPEVKLWTEWKAKHLAALQEKSKQRVAAKPEFATAFDENKKNTELPPQLEDEPDDKKKDLQAEEAAAIVGDMVPTWPAEMR